MTAVEREVVAALEEALIRRIGEPRYNLWFARSTKLSWEDDLLLVGVPNLMFQEWLDSAFAEPVRAAASDVLGRPMRVRFVIDPELFRAARREQASVAEGRPDLDSPPDLQRPADRPRPMPRQAKEAPRPARGLFEAIPPAREHSSTQRRWRRLSDFVVGTCNRMAHAAAQSVVEAPGESANPLIVYGAVGTGKTHLLEGIYAGIRKLHPSLRICYTTAEEFTHRFVQSMRLGKLGSFRKNFRECGVLLLDDLNFLASKKATQEEFLHSFDTLQADGKQIVATCDCHPKLTEEFSAELTDRLLGGAIWSLLPPDATTRLDILRAKAGVGEPALPDEVLSLVAEILRGNVRELEGAVHTLRHFARVAGKPVNMCLAREALGDLLRHAVRVVTLEQVDRAVCRVLHLAAGALQSHQRTWAVSHPRMLAMYLGRKHTAAAYSEVGQHFGGRNHSTVLAAEKKVRAWIRENAELVLGDRRCRASELVELVERELLR